MDVLVLSRDQVTPLLDVDALIDALADGLRALSLGEVFAPPRIAVRGEADGMLAVMPGAGSSVGMGVKLVSVFPHNHGVGLPSHQAVIVLFDMATGTPLALMDGTSITAVRTAATSALAARMLARRDASILAIIGAGVQGASHLDALPRVRSVSSIRVASRTFAHASALAARDPRCVAVESFEEAVRGADIVCCCTDSGVPVISRSWLAPGAHVSSVGGSVLLGPEVDAETIDAASVFVESRIACSPPPSGTHELAHRAPESVVELGEVLAGLRPGRTSDDELTVWKSMGHAVEDLVAARLVYSAAVAGGVGTTVSL